MNKEAAGTTVLVTGASGYIALHCILQLLRQGYRVRGTLRSPAREENLRQALAQQVDGDDRLSFVTADLLSDEGWADAVAGCRYVLHIASPNATVEPKDENVWIAPAREGTLRILRAAAEAGVARVVMTSSIAAVYRGHDTEERLFTEADWSILDAKSGAYVKSKTLAERAAWEFVDELPEDKKLELSAICPGYVIGPLLDDDEPTSVSIVSKFLGGKVPGCVQVGFNLVDVRDTAGAHLLAMTAPQAAGKRFICTAEFYWQKEIALILEKHFAHRGYPIPTRTLPNFALHLAALFDGSLQRIVPTLGQKVNVSSELLRNTLDWQPRPVEEAIVATAESLIEYGDVAGSR